MFWDDPAGDLLNYLCEPGPWATKIVAIAHNTKAFVLHFIVKRAILQKWKTELITKGLKIININIEHLLLLLDSVSILPCALRKLPEAFGLEATK